MYYAQHPTIIESDDILEVTSYVFSSGDTPSITFTCTLRPDKDYHPMALHLTNGVDHRMLPLPSVQTGGVIEGSQTEPLQANETEETEDDDEQGDVLTQDRQDVLTSSQEAMDVTPPKKRAAKKAGDGGDV